MVLVADRVIWNRGARFLLGRADLPCPVGPREARSDSLPDLPPQEALSVRGLVNGLGPFHLLGDFPYMPPDYRQWRYKLAVINLQWGK